MQDFCRRADWVSRRQLVWKSNSDSWSSYHSCLVIKSTLKQCFLSKSSTKSNNVNGASKNRMKVVKQTKLYKILARQAPVATRAGAPSAAPWYSRSSQNCSKVSMRSCLIILSSYNKSKCWLKPLKTAPTRARPCNSTLISRTTTPMRRYNAFLNRVFTT